MKFTLECWQDGPWYAGTVREIPGVFSQGKSLEELKENMVDACRLMLAEGDDFGPGDSGVPSRPSEPPSLETSVELKLPEDIGGV